MPQQEAIITLNIIPSTIALTRQTPYTRNRVIPEMRRLRNSNDPLHCLPFPPSRYNGTIFRFVAFVFPTPLPTQVFYSLPASFCFYFCFIFCFRNIIRPSPHHHPCHGVYGRWRGALPFPNPLHERSRAREDSDHSINHTY